MLMSYKTDTLIYDSLHRFENIGQTVALITRATKYSLKINSYLHVYHDMWWWWTVFKINSPKENTKQEQSRHGTLKQT